MIVPGRPGLPAKVPVEVLQPAQDAGQAPLAAQVLDLQVAQSVEGLTALDPAESLALQRLDGRQ